MTVSLVLIQLLDKYGVSAMIKYPNDIIVNNKKIAGVLVEIISLLQHKYAISGIGLNVNNEFFKDYLLDAISMHQITYKKFNKLELFKSLICNIKEVMSIYTKKQYVIKNLYIEFLFGHKKFIPCLYKKEKIHVKIVSITNKGFLTLLIQDFGFKTVNALEVKFLLS